VQPGNSGFPPELRYVMPANGVRQPYCTIVTVAELEVTPPAVAVTVAVPTLSAVQTPDEVMVAAPLGVPMAFQVAVLVTLPVEPFWYVAGAVNCTELGPLAPPDTLKVWVRG